MDLNKQIKSLESKLEICKQNAIKVRDKIQIILNSSTNIKKSDTDTYKKNYLKISENMKSMQSKLTKLYEKKNSKILSKTLKLKHNKNSDIEFNSNPSQLKLAMSKIAF